VPSAETPPSTTTPEAPRLLHSESLSRPQSHSRGGNAAPRFKLSQTSGYTGDPRTRSCVTGGAPGLRIVKSPAKRGCAEDINIMP